MLSKIVKRKPTGKRPPRRPWCSWEDTIKLNVKGKGFQCVEMDDPAQNKYYWRCLVNAALNLRTPYAIGLVTSSMCIQQYKQIYG